MTENLQAHNEEAPTRMMKLIGNVYGARSALTQAELDLHEFFLGELERSDFNTINEWWQMQGRPAMVKLLPEDMHQPAIGFVEEFLASPMEVIEEDEH